MPLATPGLAGHAVIRGVGGIVAGRKGRFYLAGKFALTVVAVCSSTRALHDIRMGDDGIGAWSELVPTLTVSPEMVTVHGLFNLAQIIDGNAAALAVGAVEGAAGDVQIQGVAMLRVVAGIGAADHYRASGNHTLPE